MDDSHGTDQPVANAIPFFESHGIPLRFNYHRIGHNGEHLPPVSKVVPAVWSNRVADKVAYLAIHRWICKRDKEAMVVIILAAIRCLNSIAWAKGFGGNQNGDNMGAAIEAAFDEIVSWPNNNPGYTDLHHWSEPTFWEPARPAEHSEWLTYYYIRWIKRAARRAIANEVEERHRLRTLPADFDALCFRGRTQRKNGTKKVVVRADTRDPSQLAFDREIENEVADGLPKWFAGTPSSGMLANWLDANVDDPIEKEILKVKATAPWRTHKQIVQVVNKALGTQFTHDKVTKCLRMAEQKMTEWLSDEYGFRPTEGRAASRASGEMPQEPAIEGKIFEPPTATIQAEAQYELDADGYKIGPKNIPYSLERCIAFPTQPLSKSA